MAITINTLSNANQKEGNAICINTSKAPSKISKIALIQVDETKQNLRSCCIELKIVFAP